MRLMRAYSISQADSGRGIAVAFLTQAQMKMETLLYRISNIVYTTVHTKETSIKNKVLDLGFLLLQGDM